MSKIMNKILKANLLFSIICSISWTSCTEKNVPDKPIVDNQIYKACCGVEPVEFTNDSGAYLFIPNAFTPNGDGINDFFFPVVNYAEYGYYSIIIFSGDWANDPSSIILYKKDFVTGNNWISSGWNGRDLNGDLYSGLFTYVIGCFHNEQEAKHIGHEGKACAIACETGKEFKDKQGCFFSIQVTNDNKLDKNIPNWEDNCFE